MKLIVGLGNPGEKYSQTRHNLGFMVVDALWRKLTPVQKTNWEFNKKINSLTAKLPNLLLIKPQSLMNASGFNVASAAAFYKINSADIWVIHDDLDLPLGKIKIKKGSGSAGHRGIESISQQLGNDFVRFRLGISHPRHADLANKQAVDNYVLSYFNNKEAHEVKKMIKKTVKLVRLALQNGVAKAAGQAS